MGFNALRRYRGQKIVDVVLLIAMSLVILALVLWAVRG